jgi:predicted negative regulator of RcsB-dependent stress response
MGLTAARRYAAIAPDAPHALHMPSHIFTRVGAWADSTTTNHRSAEVALKGNEPDESYHATDYAVYAQLQLARDADAWRDLQQTLQVTGINTARFTAPYARAAMPARYALERGAWDEAAQLKPEPASYPYVAAITHFARALGALRSGGDAAAAQADAAQLAVLHKALVDGGNRYWAAEVEVQRLTIAGWSALADKKPEDALKLMRAAADLEDRSEKHIVTPGRVLPTRELLGDMLMELKHPAEAHLEYRAALQKEPNRRHALMGLHG